MFHVPTQANLYRLNLMANCETKRDDCKCDTVCDTLPLDAHLYTEVDDATFAPSDVYTHKEMD